MSILDSWLCTTPIAHRGLHNEVLPENSTGAFENAIEHGFPIELDVRTIGDGSVVVFHDGKLSRMSGLDGYVSTLEPEKLGDVHLSGTEYTIPTFEHVLEIVNGKDGRRNAELLYGRIRGAIVQSLFARIFCKRNAARHARTAFYVLQERGAFGIFPPQLPHQNEAQ